MGDGTGRSLFQSYRVFLLSLVVCVMLSSPHLKFLSLSKHPWTLASALVLGYYSLSYSYLLNYRWWVVLFRVSGEDFLGNSLKLRNAVS